MKSNMFKWLSIAAAVSSLVVFSGCGVMDEVVRALSGNQQYINKETVAAGLKEALTVGAGNAVAQTSKEGGYWKDPDLKIPLPQELEKFADALRGAGLGAEVELLEKKMNEGAETAAASAAPIFMAAIKNMTISDAKGILKGSNTAATDYFRVKTYNLLKRQYSPVIKKELEQVGAVKLYNELYEKYIQIPLVTKPDVKLEDYVTEKALDGLFSVVAKEERRIRQDPAARTSDLLWKVFAQQ
jgi:hypothetical protein